MRARSKIENREGAVLLVDDDQAASRQIVRKLSQSSLSCDFFYACSASEALELQVAHLPEVAVVDLTLDPLQGPESGFDCIKKLLAQDDTIKVIVLTADGGEDAGISALKVGASSFVVKPAEIDHLTSLIRDALSYSSLLRSYRALQAKSDDIEPILGALRSNNLAMRQLLEAALIAAPTNQAILILGETGTGKGVLAQEIHRASKISKGKFSRFLPRVGGFDLIQSELFGHERGAFTGAHEARVGLVEEANKGTLFIDEVADLPVETQLSLLHVLQDKHYRRLGSNRERTSEFRLISATNKALKESIAEGKLREDFYHRISHVELVIPPLRERPEDIPMLAEEFLNSLSTQERLPVAQFDKQAMLKLSRHAWPGNVRELKMCVESAVYRAAHHQRSTVEVPDITLRGDSAEQRGVATGTFRQKVRRYEQSLVQQALAQADGNQSRAASFLGLERSSFRRILNRSED